MRRGVRPKAMWNATISGAGARSLPVAGGAGGEIDLVARDGAEVIFIEVKQSDTHAHAAEHLGRHQMARIYAAASEFLAGEPMGQLTPMRFDVALVDGGGVIEIVENAFAA